MSPILRSVHPVLGCSRVAASIEFYARLGFTCTFRDSAIDPHYAAVRRDGVEFHLQWHDLSNFVPGGDRPTYRIVVDDVDALFAEYHRESPSVLLPVGSTPYKAPADTPWGTREFHLRDPDGNGLQFYRALGS